jgi:DNA-binding winged helix-turn-helix (wHTH) protein
MNDTQPRFYEFDSFLLDAQRRELTRDGEILPLMPKVFETLLFFVQNRGRVLEKTELMETLWADSFVEEANLTQNVSTLRKVLGESPHEKIYIVTIPGRGYRFVAEVHELPNETTDVVIHEKIRAHLTIEKEPANEPQIAALKQIAHPAPKNHWWKAAAGILLLLAAAGFYRFFIRPPVSGSFADFKPVRLTTTGKTKRAAVSPDGNSFVCFYREEPLKSHKLAVFSADGGTPLKQIEIPKTAAPFVWTPDGQAITFISARTENSNIWSQPIDGAAAQQITNFGGEQIFWFAWSKDFQTLAVSRGTIKSDAFMFRFER